MAGPGICLLFLADTCASEVHTLFNPVAPYDICFLQQILQIQNCLCVVVGPGFVSTSPAFMRIGAIHPAGLPKNGKLAPPLLGAGGFDTICTAVCIRGDSSTTCRLCHLEP